VPDVVEQERGDVVVNDMSPHQSSTVVPEMQLRRDPRMAGQVLRYHTWPSHTRQNIADHTWQLMRIVLAIWPDAPRDVLVELMFHDVGEVGTGDIPYPIKKDNPSVGREMNRLEEETRLSMCIPWGVPGPAKLPPGVKFVCKIAEFIEMWEWGAQERLMGSVFGKNVEDRCRDAWRRMFHDSDPWSSRDESIAEWEVRFDGVSTAHMALIRDRIRIYLRRRYTEWHFEEACPL
jgi:hypothetical protein